MTLDDLIGTIGGHLHLFLGMSLLSFVEIALLMFKFLASFCCDLVRLHSSPTVPIKIYVSQS